jgi:hypothetical protein
MAVDLMKIFSLSDAAPAHRIAKFCTKIFLPGPKSTH